MLDILNQLNRPKPDEFLPLPREKIGSLACGNLLDDDATLILGHFTATKVRLRDNLSALFRLLGGVRENTKLGLASESV